jgi:23S rRNA (uracil-5-)-methyltransferase RumA
MRVPDNDCPHAEVCGGCTYRGVPYEEQLDIKNRQVLTHIMDAGVRCGEYVGMRPSPHVDAYRNKMEYSFGDAVKGGPMTLGLHRRGSYMSVMDTDGCHIVPEDFNLLRRSALAYMKDRGHGFYHKRAHSGFLRNLVVRRGERTGELLVNLITTDEEAFDDAAFADFIGTLPTSGEIVGVIRTVYNGKSDTVACDRMEVLRGRGHYFEEMLGLKFRVDAFAFFQTNTAAVEGMFTEAFEMLSDLSGGKLFDIYCGTGTISLALAPRVREVLGVELVADSVRAANANAALNGIGNCRFIEGDAFEVLETLRERPDIAVVDPPRMGMHPKALKKIIAYGLREILYISCNPKTFSENMAVFEANGYRLDILKAYDNFPFTKHIELAARIIRR